MDEIFEAKLNKLQKDMIVATLAVFEHTQSAGFCVPVPHTTPTLFIAVGEPDEIQRLLASAEKPLPPA